MATLKQIISLNFFCFCVQIIENIQKQQCFYRRILIENIDVTCEINIYKKQNKNDDNDDYEPF